MDPERILINMTRDERLLSLKPTCGRTEKSCHRIRASHLLKDSDKESNLNLSRLLQKAIKSRSPLSFRKNTKP